MITVKKYAANVRNRVVYDILSMFDHKKSEITLMNYGYVGKVAGPLPDVSEGEKNRLRLYMHVLGGADIFGKDVIEIASGRGGGAYFTATELKPNLLEAIELSPKAVKFARKHFKAPGLRYSVGNAHNIPFKNDKFDVAVNIESSHWYGDTAVFFKEVSRVLKKGGHFLFADFRDLSQLPTMIKEIKRAGFSIILDEDITPNVIAALNSDNEYKKFFVNRFPKPLRGYAETFAGLKGSVMYMAFETGQRVYKNYILQKVV